MFDLRKLQKKVKKKSLSDATYMTYWVLFCFIWRLKSVLAEHKLKLFLISGGICVRDELVQQKSHSIYWNLEHQPKSISKLIIFIFQGIDYTALIKPGIV